MEMWDKIKPFYQFERQNNYIRHIYDLNHTLINESIPIVLCEYK